MFYGGKHNDNLQGRHLHTAGQHKFVNLFDIIMLSSFRGKGHTSCNV